MHVAHLITRTSLIRWGKWKTWKIFLIWIHIKLDISRNFQSKKDNILRLYITIIKWYSQLEIRIYTCDINTVSDIKYTKVHEKLLIRRLRISKCIYNHHINYIQCHMHSIIRKRRIFPSQKWKTSYRNPIWNFKKRRWHVQRHRFGHQVIKVIPFGNHDKLYIFTCMYNFLNKKITRFYI